MDLEYLEFVDGVALVVSVVELEHGAWIAHTNIDGDRFDARADTAQGARKRLLVALPSEIHAVRTEGHRASDSGL